MSYPRINFAKKYKFRITHIRHRWFCFTPGYWLQARLWGH